MMRTAARRTPTALTASTPGPRNLALAADALGAKMVQFSTDDVFAKASHHPYNEFDAPAP